MPAYKDNRQGTWYASFYFENWQGVKQKKLKRGFATKKDALAWEREFLLQQAADLTMTFEAFVEIYITDKKKRLRENTWFTKEHGLKFASRLEHTLDGSQQEYLHCLASVIVLRSTEKMVQDVGYPLCSIPFQAVQIVPDGVVAVLIGNNADGRFNLLLAGYAVFLHPPQDILHVGVIQRLAGTRPAHRLYNVDALAQQIQPDGIGKHMVVLQYQFTVSMVR